MSYELSICAISVLCHSKFGCEYIQPQTVEDRSITVETISLVPAERSLADLDWNTRTL